MWAKARAVGNAPALFTGRAGARQRIVHMSTACGWIDGRGCALVDLLPWAAGARSSHVAFGDAGFA
jgi:hypothetical protein